MTVRPLGLHDVAVRLGRGYDWFRREWRRLVREEGFPPPFIGAEPHQSPRWLHTAVDAWAARRSGEAVELTAVEPAQPQARAAPSPANDASPHRPDPAGRMAALLAAAGG